MQEVHFYGCLYPFLATLPTCSKQIRHIKTKLKSTSTPTLYFIFPMLEKLKYQLNNVSKGIMTNALVAEPTLQFATLMICNLNEMRTHHPWIAFSMLKPGMREFPFFVHSRNRDSALGIAKDIIKKMMC